MTKPVGVFVCLVLIATIVGLGVLAIRQSTAKTDKACSDLANEIQGKVFDDGRFDCVIIKKDGGVVRIP